MAIINLSLTDGFSLADQIRVNSAIINLSLVDGFPLYDEAPIGQTQLNPINLNISDNFAYAAPITHLGEYGLDFDGGDDYVLITNRISLTGAATWGMWVKPDITGPTQGLISKRDGVGTNDWQLYISNTNPTSLYVLLWGLTVVAHISPAGFFAAGVWVHAVVTYDGSTVKIFKNGAEVYSGGANGNIDDRDIDTRIGDDWYGNNFDGIIDEPAIWNRVLSADEIRELATKKKPTLDANTVGLWHMDENGGSDDWVVDASTNSNHGIRKPAYPANVPNYVWTGDRPLLLSVLPDAFNYADPIIAPRVRLLTTKDAFNYADPLSKMEEYYLSLKDAFTYADILSKKEAYYLALKDAFTYADPLSKMEEYYLALKDAFNYADPLTRLLTRRLVLKDAFNYADILSKLEEYYLSLKDAFTYADPLSKLEEYYLSLKDAFTYADPLSKMEEYYLELKDAFVHLGVSRAPDLDISRAAVPFLPKTIAQVLEGAVSDNTIAQSLEG